MQRFKHIPQKKIVFVGTICLILICSYARGQMGSRSLTPFSKRAMKEAIPSKSNGEHFKQDTHNTILDTLSDDQNDNQSKNPDLSDNEVLSIKNDFDAKTLPRFGLYGIGNTNTETFTTINSSGKISGYIRPYKGVIGKKLPSFIDINFGFNVNASNTDSLMATTFLFPDVGNNSFSTSVTFNSVFGSGSDYYLISPFFSFATKTIKGRKADSTRSFYTLNSSLGVNFQYLCVEGKDNIAFSASPYLAWVNVPDPGSKNYKYLFTGDEKSALTTSVKSWGVKIAFQYNSFQIFADLRTVTGSEAELPAEGLKGFHPNIGIVFNAEIFER